MLTIEDQVRVQTFRHMSAAASEKIKMATRKIDRAYEKNDMAEMQYWYGYAEAAAELWREAEGSIGALARASAEAKGL